MKSSMKTPSRVPLRRVKEALMMLREAHGRLIVMKGNRIVILTDLGLLGGIVPPTV
jgi:hypothetical protein